MSLSFFLQKKVYIPVIIVLIVGAFSYRSYQQKNAPPTYETVKVEQGTLLQTVDATGKLEAVDDLSLRFEVPGLLANVTVKEGMNVKAGTLLGNLRLSEFNAAVAQAQASLNQRLAPVTNEDKTYYQSAVQSAEAALNQAKIDTQTSLADAEAAVLTAENNLRLAESTGTSVVITQAYEKAVTALQSSLPKIDDAIVQADNVLGVDNITGAASFQPYLSTANPAALNQARLSYGTAKAARDAARSRISTLTSASSHDLIDESLQKAEAMQQATLALLADVSEVLANSVPGGTLTQALLDGFKSSIQLARTSVSAELTASVAQKQAIVNAKNSVTSLRIAYNKAVTTRDQIKANATNIISIREAAYKQAFANLQAKLNPPRAVDVAPLRASLAQAVANREKAYIRAPIDGQVTKVAKKVGELVSSADIVFKLLSPRYEVQVDVQEVDVPKLTLNDTVTIVLDAFGPDTKFTGQVVTIDPAATLVQDVVYYRVRIRLDPTTLPVKPGMTANVSILTEKKDNVLSVPTRVVRTGADDRRYVLVLENGAEKEVAVKTGLRANEGRLEITEGLIAGQDVVVSKKEAGEK